MLNHIIKKFYNMLKNFIVMEQLAYDEYREYIEAR
jgi:hypothetical protein